MKLSKYFTTQELEASQTASRLGIDNSIPPELMDNARYMCAQMDIVRDYLRHPILVTSGYRSPTLNKNIAGSAKNSSHMSALAMDFHCPGFGSVLDVCHAINKMPNFDFDQLIHEYGGWVHIGFQKPYRKQLLTADKLGWRVGLLSIRK
jgi:zinc D-Ala-D-Ala carboxypeptidase